MATEKRLIDANALSRDAFRIKQFGKGIRCVVDWDDIEAAPTVDAVKVVHGQWQYVDDPDEDGNIQAYCSVCGAGDKHAGCMVGQVPYCWKCGAKMDGDENA